MITRTFLTSLALIGLGLTGSGHAAMLGGDPGPSFDMPGGGDYYLWDMDLSGLSAGSILLDFTVNVPTGGAFLRTFQVFALDDTRDGCVDGRFSLSVNQPGNETWTSVAVLEPCSYHDYLNINLLEGPRNFVVTVESLPRNADHANVRFGDIIPAIPLPAPALLLMGGLAAMAGLRRARA